MWRRSAARGGARVALLGVLGLCLHGWAAGQSRFHGQAASYVDGVVYVQIAAATRGSMQEEQRDLARLVCRDSSGGVMTMTPDFSGAEDPSLDATGRWLLFSGRRTGEAYWQIWAIDLAMWHLDRITREPIDSFEPAALPAGGVAFQRNGEIYRTDVNGSPPTCITFSGGHARSPVLLPDGRLLVRLTSQPRRFFTLNPDGTWMTGLPEWGASALHDASVLGSDRILFIEDAGDLRIGSLDDPFAPVVALATTGDWAFRSPARSADPNEVLVATQERSESNGTFGFGIYSLRLANDSEPKLVFRDSGMDDVEPTVLAPRPIPPNLPSTVNAEKSTAELYVWDIRRTDDPALEPGMRTATGIRVLEVGPGERRPLLDVVPDADGSVYMRLPADRTLGFQLLAGAGEVIAEMTTPFWLRPNEQRGCLGCHVSPRYAPPNIRPRALGRPPTEIDTPHRTP